MENKKISVKILYARHWKFTGRDGDPVEGNTYGARKSDGGGVTFTSPNAYNVGDEIEVVLRERWDEEKSVIKFSEVVSR